ncbi:hypothetical protein EWM64_g4465 [Hericium alpestre]|uniref:Retrotransposon gag domain-containing protein n=1 Tax=Hericium alpestre TaxID=135208 RepID=A0A4Y9ZZQ3_9AGAM|nr:hypothetical protein EWM64_g4465 [Hericium alpestre]
MAGTGQNAPGAGQQGQAPQQAGGAGNAGAAPQPQVPLALLEQLMQDMARDFTAVATAATTPRPTPRHQPKPKFQEPEPFMDVSQWKVFKRQVDFYLTGNWENYPLDRDKIRFVISYCHDGLPGEWAENYLMHEHFNLEYDLILYMTFITDMTARFEDPNKERKAHIALTALKQGKMDAGAFFQKFEILRAEAGYNDRIYDGQCIDLIEKNINSSIIEHIYLQDTIPDMYARYKEKIITIDGQIKRFQAIKA